VTKSEFNLNLSTQSQILVKLFLFHISSQPVFDNTKNYKTFCADKSLIDT